MEAFSLFGCWSALFFAHLYLAREGWLGRDQQFTAPFSTQPWAASNWYRQIYPSEKWSTILADKVFSSQFKYVFTDFEKNARWSFALADINYLISCWSLCHLPFDEAIWIFQFLKFLNLDFGLNLNWCCVQVACFELRKNCQDVIASVKLRVWINKYLYLLFIFTYIYSKLRLGSCLRGSRCKTTLRLWEAW